MKFKPGDKVICVKPSVKLEEDKIYTVQEYRKHKVPDMDYVLCLMEFGTDEGEGFFETRFKLFEPRYTQFLDKLKAIDV